MPRRALPTGAASPANRKLHLDTVFTLNTDRFRGSKHMIGFTLGLLVGGAIASGIVYGLYFWVDPVPQAAAKPPSHPEKISTPVAESAPASAPAAEEASHEGPGVQLPIAKTESATPRAETSSEKEIWIDDLTDRIEGEIGSHSFRIQEISASLRSAKEGDPDMVLDAASRIMLANQRLQAELASARAEIDEHRAKVKELTAEARTDILTGLPNRRAFLEDLDRRFEQWNRHKVPLSVIMLDIDRFKSMNDRYTHAGGDAALRHLGEQLRAALRQMDVPARYGGEEFAVILPGTKLPDAINVAERLRATIAASSFRYEEHTLGITASLGLATVGAGDTVSTIVERADQALYAAKQAGRNCAYVHDGEAHLPIESDKALVRHPFRDLQQIAPFRLGSTLPTAADFFPVRCYDLSTKGISFLTTAPPDFQALVIRLGNPPGSRYMISSIANVAPMQLGDELQYRVGCTFVSRLDPEEIIESPLESSRPAERQLVGA